MAVTVIETKDDVALFTQLARQFHKDLKAIMRFANRLPLNQRKALALPSFEKGSRYKKIPSYTAVYNLLTQLDSDAFSEGLIRWLAQRSRNTKSARRLR